MSGTVGSRNFGGNPANPVAIGTIGINVTGGLVGRYGTPTGRSTGTDESHFGIFAAAANPESPDSRAGRAGGHAGSFTGPCANRQQDAAATGTRKESQAAGATRHGNVIDDNDESGEPGGVSPRMNWKNLSSKNLRS